MTSCGRLFLLALLLTAWSRAQSPYERGGRPLFSGYDVERLSRVRIEGGLANQPHSHSADSSFPFGSVPQASVYHNRALHGQRHAGCLSRNEGYRPS